jgi:hypothetical protein
MKFIVSRTSNSICIPCAHSVFEEINGDGDKRWTIEIKDLNDLIKFLNIYGKCVLRACNAEAEIEIYDDFRE